MINFKTIIRIIGILLLLETTMFLVCSGVSFYYRESDMLDFWKAGGITAGVGLLLAFLGKGGERQLTRRDGYVLVSFAWVAFSLSECCLLYRWVHSRHYQRILRDHVRFQQYGRHHLE